MANVNSAYGLRPLMRNHSGGAVQAEPYNKLVGYAQKIFKWDPVTLLAGGLKGPASGITPGTTRLLGVALDSDLTVSHAAVLHVIDSPSALFDVQGDGTGSSVNIIDATTEGYNANLVAAAGGGVTRDNSGSALAESTIAVTSTLDVNFRRLLNVTTNAYGIYGRCEIKINKHLLNPEVTET